MKYNLRSKLWIYPGEAAWHFLTINKKTTVEIKKKFSDLAAGFGSIKVEVTIGKSKWRTSIFPDNKSKTYLLPVKTSIRKAESLAANTTVNYIIKIVVD